MATRTFTDNTDNIVTTITKEDSTNTDVLNMEVPFSTTIEIGDTVNYYDKDSNLIFAGIVQTVKTADIKQVQVYDYGAELLQRTVNEIFNNKSPEQIIQDVLSNYTTLTYSSSISSGITISTYVANKKKAWDIVTEMTEVLLANFRVDVNKNFILELEGAENSVKSIKTGSAGNAILDGEWEEDKSKLANSVTVDGDDRQVFEREPELFSGTGSEQTITLSEIPLDIKIENPVGTVLTGFVEGSTTGDYTLDRENKQVTGTFASGTDNIQATYTVSIPISIRRSNKDSIDTYGQHDKTFKKPYLKSRNDARKLAQFLIDRFSNPLKKARFQITNKSDFEDYDNWLPNQVIQVQDVVFGISGSFIIRKVERKNNGELFVSVGDEDDDFISWSKEAQQRIKQLEEKDDNTTILSEDELIEENVTIQYDVELIEAEKRVIDSDTLYWLENQNTNRTKWRGDGTGSLWKLAGYTSTDLSVSNDILVSEDGITELSTEGGELLSTEGGQEEIANDGVVTVVYQNTGRSNFITHLSTLITHIATGDDNTTPTISDTSLGNETFIDSLFDSASFTSTNVSFTIFQDTTEKNSNSILEVGSFDAASGGNMYSRSLSNVIAKTSNKEVFVEVLFNVDTENTDL